MRYKNEYAEFISNRITELRMNKGVSEREMSLALGRSHSYIMKKFLSLRVNNRKHCLCQQNNKR